jgi:hypothetical protein
MLTFRSTAFVAVIGAAACSTSRQVAERMACAGGRGPLDGERVGTLRLGMSIDSAKILCPTAVDTIEYAEGEPIRVLIARVNADTIRIYPFGNSIWTMWVNSPAFQTQDSLKVGMPLTRLIAMPKLTGGFGEGDFYLLDDSGSACGLSFQLDAATAHRLAGVDHVGPETLQPYASSSRIIAVLVRGCRRR